MLARTVIQAVRSGVSDPPMSDARKPARRKAAAAATKSPILALFRIFGEIAATQPMQPSLLESLHRHRTAKGLTRRALALRAGMRPELLSRLDSQTGCDTATLQKLADALGLELVLQPKATPITRSKAQRLGLSMPHDWSNPEIPDIALIRKYLEFANLADLTRLALEFGIDRLETEMRKMPATRTRAAALVLPNIRAALAA